MKVKNERKVYSANGICDFCGVREAKHSINGSLWFICTPCMNEHYPPSPRDLGMEEEE